MSDRIQCLECGRWFRFLGPHLRVHDITAEEYRGKHGLNIRTPLAGEEYRAESAARTKRLGIGREFKGNLTPNTKQGRKFKRRPECLKRRRSDYQKLAKAGTEAARKVDRIGLRLAKLGPYPVTVLQAMERLKCTDRAAYTFLGLCVRRGLLVRIKRGLYSVPLYSIGTWDTEANAYTLQEGLEDVSVNVDRHQLRRTLHALRGRMYGAWRRRYDGDYESDPMVMVERTDGKPLEEILVGWERDL